MDMASKGGSKGGGGKSGGKANTQKPIEVAPRGDEWAAKQQGAERAIKVGDKKADVVERAREVAKNKEAELIIKNADGTIRQRESYGNDPNPPKDKEH
jgi:hypothetical protein